MPSQPRWGALAEAKVKEFHERGLSYSQIANAMTGQPGVPEGVTRSSISGLLYRMRKRGGTGFGDHRLDNIDPEPPQPKQYAPLPLTEPAHNGCRKLVGESYCRRARQPGRDLCAEHHRQMVVEPWADAMDAWREQKKDGPMPAAAHGPAIWTDQNDERKAAELRRSQGG